MRADLCPPISQWLTPPRRGQWDADVAGLRDLHAQQDLLPLRMGDLFNELKGRWGDKLPALARAAGVSYHAARQRARLARQIPPGSRLRTLGLPFSILRHLAPVAEQERWAQKALALQKVGMLHGREFAKLLEEGGARRPRARRPPRCLCCGGEVAESAERAYIRRAEQSGWLCGTPCALAYLAGTAPAPAAETLPAAGQKCDSESQNRVTDSQNRDTESQSGEAVVEKRGEKGWHPAARKGRSRRSGSRRAGTSRSRPRSQASRRAPPTPQPRASPHRCTTIVARS
jgi:hypothetical protein